MVYGIISIFWFCIFEWIVILNLTPTVSKSVDCRLWTVDDPTTLLVQRLSFLVIITIPYTLSYPIPLMPLNYSTIPLIPFNPPQSPNPHALPSRHQPSTIPHQPWVLEKKKKWNTKIVELLQSTMCAYPLVTGWRKGSGAEVVWAVQAV